MSIQVPGFYYTAAVRQELIKIITMESVTMWGERWGYLSKGITIFPLQRLTDNSQVTGPPSKLLSKWYSVIMY